MVFEDVVWLQHMQLIHKRRDDRASHKFEFQFQGDLHVLAEGVID